MTKKKIVSLCLAAVLVVMAIAGATVAYFTDTKSAENTFTMGNVQIKLDETNVADPNATNRVTSNTYGIADVYPGATLTKDPVVHNTGKNPAYIRGIVTIENGMNWLGLYNDNVWTAPQEDAFYALINNTLGQGWELVDISYVPNATRGTTDFVATLEYTGVLAAGADTTAMFSQIQIPEKITGNDVTTRISQDGEFHIDVVAQAIQANSFDTWEAAFAAYDAK